MIRLTLLLLAGCAERPVAPRATAQAEDECAGCHAAEHREWAASMHHASFTSPDFQQSWKVEPQPFCADCHAPRRSQPGGEAAGIGCAECHGELEAHRARRAPATTKPCTPCHDFPVPGESAKLQSTATEHAASRYASTPCEGCHLPVVGSHRDHGFAASRDRAALGQALVASSARPYDGRSLAVTVRTVGVGHRFPTGDIFRRVRFTVTGVDEGGRIVCDATASAQRDWTEHRRALRDHDAERDASDTRLGDEPLVIEAPCVAAPARVRVDAHYARGATADSAHFRAFGAELPILHVDLDPRAKPEP